VTLEDFGYIFCWHVILVPVFGGLGAWVSSQRGRSEIEGFCLGAVFSILGVLIEALLPCIYREESKWLVHSTRPIEEAGGRCRPAVEPCVVPGNLRSLVFEVRPYVGELDQPINGEW